MKKSSPKILTGFSKEKKLTRDNFQIDKTIQILQMPTYIFIYIPSDIQEFFKPQVHNNTSVRLILNSR